MQLPLQQTFLLGSGVQALPRFTQGFWHALAAAQTVCPVSWRSVQHPVSQSEALVQVFSHVEVVGDCFTQLSPSQQLGLQLPPAFLHMHSEAAAQIACPVP